MLQVRGYKMARITGRRGITLRNLAWLLVIMLFPAVTCLAEEIFYVGGGFGNRTDTGGSTAHAYWWVGYSQGITDNTMFSITYLNEGHQPDHARDGLAPQLWARTSPVKSRISLAAGLGPYLYSDTRTNEIGPKDIRHDVGLIGSASATWYGLSPFILQARADYIHASAFDTLGWTIGVGYLLSDEKTSTPFEFNVGKNEIDVYVGRTVLNIDHSESTSIAVEYRRKLFRYLDWSIGYLHEGNDRPVGRYGILTEVWLAREFFHDRIALGIGAGPYFAHDRYGGDDGQRDAVLGAVSFTGAVRFTPHVGLRLIFHRIITDNDRDTDVFMGGLALTF